MTTTRRLAAILAADVVGFSRLMEQDEAGTLAALKSRRKEVLGPLVAKHQGRVFKITGDGVLVEFASAVNAVQCAVELQQGFAEANKDIPDDRRIILRIGVNLGDVMVESGDLYGDGVNIAARLEALAEPGGILVSGKLRDEVGRRLELAFDDLGERTLKNIATPVQIYRLRTGRADVPSPGLPLPDKPSVAVLPFQNMSGDPEQEYLADGLTEDIITALSRVRNLFVIARNSTFVYKGQAVDVTRVARELGVRYVLEGSIRKSGRRIRITAQLIDATTGRHVWAEKFDRELVEIFDLQDEITRNVVASTQTQIMLAEGNPTLRRDRPDLDLWGLVSQAMARIHDLTPDTLAAAKALADRALSIDPQCGPAWRCLAMALYHQAHMLVVADHDATLASALEAAQRSVQFDHDDEYGLWILGIVLLALRQHDRAIAALERAIEINPNYATACGSLGTALCYVGRAAEGNARNEIAIRSDPLNPAVFFRYSGLALGHYLTGDFEHAVDWARKSIRRNRNWYLGHVYLIAALGRLNRIEEAAAARQDYLSLFPEASIAELRRLPFKSVADFELLCDGLRKAGLPE